MPELWQQAVKWLNSVGVLPPDCSALSPTARVYDLALALQVCARPACAGWLMADIRRTALFSATV